ncbi:nitrous oxide reductase family maturation protein NosD [Duodenibacillus massiliensis]|jgi:nitrous oxidase accessory protein|uniref:nitrous oxide reductase family maturation protein NosD n=1 Tax=Duodenibacillus massiliensis TaxID=1852381 RepID=UPI002FD95179
MSMRFFVLSLVFVLASIGVSRASPLQQAIDKAPSGAVIALGPGFYEGNIAISKPLTLRASGKGVVIHGDGTGSVITVTASYVTVDGLTIENSGPKHQTVDAGITVRGADNVKILRNRIRDCLFGVNFEQTNRSVIEDNDITSLPVSLGLKGDGIRLWYSHGNLIRMNRTRYVRDNVFWYSSANKIYENSGADSRYSLHFMYADRNEILSNDYRRNSVGIFLMFSQGSTLKRNFVADSTGPFGIGIGMKESSDILVEENQILYNARGFYLDSSPYQPGTFNTFRGNEINFNTTAFLLHGTLLPSLFESNVFKGNIEDVANDTPESKLEINTWRSNYWDNYEGFDRNDDGYGDIPHEQWMYADRIWSYLPAAKFFYASPVLDFMNFLWRLMPFSEPVLLARDARPQIRERGTEK